MSYELRQQSNGSFALYRPDLGETMHPRLGPWEEALRLYVRGTQLEALLAAGGSGPVVLFDVGLGGAANALAALSTAQEARRRGRPVRPLRIVSFESDPEAPRFALANAQALGYPRGYEPALEALLSEGSWRGEGVTWELRLGDFTRLIAGEPCRADAVFFDPFSPRGNPDMWTVAVLENVYRCRRPGLPMRLATYSSAFGVRAALLLAGFYVGEGPELAAGRRATVASTDFSGLPEPLGLPWLARWRRDREPWPPGTDSRGHRSVRERLLAHSQWSHFQAGAGQEEPAVPRRPPRRRR
jgi:tRNA U34 5-methylaminomethyl-2-thiouridine-forming methyltransferase MnmC